MRKILIVDDEEKLLDLLSRALKKNRAFEVVTATTIEEAEYAIKHAFFDIVLADIRLTGVLGRQGLELLPYVAGKSPRTKVIIMTAYGSPEIEEEAYERGAFYYFEKPIDLRILYKKLDEIGINNRNIPAKRKNTKKRK